MPGPGHAGQAGYQEVITSGLRGKGRCRLSTGAKWKTCSEAAGDAKYVVANGSGRPDIGMHRSAVEGDPHSVLEGLIWHMRSAQQGSSCHPLSRSPGRIKEAVRQAHDYGLLGKRSSAAPSALTWSSMKAAAGMSAARKRR